LKLEQLQFSYRLGDERLVQRLVNHLRTIADLKVRAYGATAERGLAPVLTAAGEKLKIFSARACSGSLRCASLARGLLRLKLDRLFTRHCQSAVEFNS
jgi:hypothetical protein